MNPALTKILTAAKTRLTSRQFLTHLPWCAGLLLIVLVLFGQYLISGTQVVSQFGTDIYNYYLHAQTFASSELSRGNIPTWNPYTYGGHPFLADFQSAMLYPITWVLGTLLNPVTALNWWVATHVFLFGLLTYIWGASRGMKPAAAFVAATAAMLGGTFYMHVFAGHISNLGSMAWAPLVFIGIDGWLRSKHAGWLIAGAAGAALQVYAGHPQYVYYTAIVAGIYSLVHLHWLGRQVRRTLIGLILLYPLAILLSAGQLLPGYNALSETVRSTGSSYDFASMFSFNPENILTLIAPWIYGGDGQALYWGRCYLWEMQMFFGTCMLMLAAHGFAGLGRANRWRMTIMLLVVAILALGAYMPVYPLLYKFVPFYGAFRGTSKFIYLFGLFAAMLAGFGAHRLLTDDKPTRKFPIACLIAGALVLIAGLVIKIGGPGDIWNNAFSLISSSKGDTYYNLQAVLAQMPDFKTTARALTSATLIGNGAWLLAFGALVLAAQHRRQIIWAAGACAIINLGVFAYTATGGFEAAQAIVLPNARIAKTISDKQPSMLDFIRYKQIEKPGDPRNDFRTLNLLVSSANMSWRSENIWGYDPSVLKRYAEYMYYSQGLNPDDASQNSPFRQVTPMLDLFRCRFVFTATPDGVTPIERPGSQTRFLIVSNYKTLKTRDEVLAEVANPLFNPRQTVVLENTPNPIPEQATVAYAVKLLGSTSDSWTIDVVCDHAAILVMTDAYAKGWKATPLPGSVQSNYNVMPANYAMRAIPLAQGHHMFKLEYNQPGLATGVKLTLLATLLLAILACVPVFRRRLDFSIKETLVHASTDDHDIETVPCANCGGTDTEPVCQKQVPDGRVYTMVSCNHCGLAYINPRLTQEAILATYRDSAYFQRGEGEVTGYNDYTIDRPLHERFFTTQLDSIEKQVPRKGRILDIGCAFGYLLNKARERGWQTEGIELSGNALQYSRNEMKLTVHDKPLRDVAFPPNTFNAVVMDDVIEHYGDPAAEIREVARILVKGGAYLLHTPNYASPWRTLLGEKWVHLKPEEHLYYFSPATLSDMLRKNGFTIIYARPRGKATNLAYIMGVSKKFLPALGHFLEKTLGRLALAKKPFSFHGGGFEVLAVKK